ncbi:hypothetical protein BDP81DRAFT_508837 [Colletotrichum phormii]|uniref:Uncharacterized protein n=1 Tax=Colletotrichum phormii TaxID=359342 RepID=A0AAI9ZXI2_9PEZI|nr:uncharacterized protein BDP81DRAFT_508837 [Colletotrichum phormii]KAK1640039.1 hypothetical protein BDP81DRAFT_508837 [Colletotrichum phormii]
MTDKDTNDTARRREQIRFLHEYFQLTFVLVVQTDMEQWVEQACIFPDFLLLNISKFLNYDTRQVPGTIAEFTQLLAPIFNTDVTSCVTAGMQSFDDSFGLPCADDFIAQKTMGDWFRAIIWGLYRLIQNEMRETTHADGADEDNMNATTFNIQQIHLRGRTILEAWASEPKTRQLSCISRGRELQPDPESLHVSPSWTPATTPGNNFVYHGSAGHYTDTVWRESFANAPFYSMAALDRTNQMSPPPPVNVVSTTFSPLRGYLWAAFNRCLLSMISARNILPKMQTNWTVGGAEYSGVVLFQFNTTQPAQSGLTHYIIEEGKEESRGARSLRDTTWAPEEVSWGRFRDLHGQEGSVWPDVIHGLEYGGQLRQLTHPRTNRWRTTWK